MFKYAAFFLLYLSTAHAQVASIGPCPSIAAVKDFDVSRYMGKWYEQRRFFAVFEAGGKCVTATYTATDHGVKVVNKEVDEKTNMEKTIEGEAKFVGAPGEGKLSVHFPILGPFTAPYNVLDTDYANYSVVWSCTDIFGLANFQFAWILTREKNPSEDIVAKTQKIVLNKELRMDNFHKTTQDCDN